MGSEPKVLWSCSRGDKSTSLQQYTLAMVILDFSDFFENLFCYGPCLQEAWEISHYVGNRFSVVSHHSLGDLNQTTPAPHQKWMELSRPPSSKAPEVVSRPKHICKKALRLPRLYVGHRPAPQRLNMKAPILPKDPRRLKKWHNLLPHRLHVGGFRSMKTEVEQGESTLCQSFSGKDTHAVGLV